MKEAHADMSSTATEVYAAGNAACEMLYHGYVAKEHGNPIPKPMTLQIDNTACIAFVNNSSFKTTLKHIDCRQEWVRALRDKQQIIPQWVQTADNLADLFTKILPAPTFIRLRDLIMDANPAQRA